MRPGRQGVSLAIICLGMLAAPLDTAVNIALPGISQAFASGLGEIRWIVICYVLCYSSLLLICGKLGDLFGYRVVFQAGLAVSAIGFLGCSAAPAFEVLLGCRMLQGVGIALTLSCAPALATLLYPDTDRVRVLGIYAAVTAAGAALGPIVGGMLVERFGWSSVFWARAPLVLLALPLSFLLPQSIGSSGGKRPSTASFDFGGGLLLMACLVPLLLGLALSTTSASLAIPGLLWLVAAIALGSFVRHENRHPEPILRPALFRDARFSLMNVQSILVNYAGFVILLVAPYYIVNVRELGAAKGGLVLALAGIGSVAGASLTGRLAGRVSTAWLSVFGMVLSVVGLVTIALTARQQGLGPMIVSLLLHGLGLGIFQVAYADLVTASLPVKDRGVAGSLTMVTRTIGIVAGATAHAAIQRFGDGRARAAGASPDDAFLAGFEIAFMAAGFAAAVALGLAICQALMREKIVDAVGRADDITAR